MKKIILICIKILALNFSTLIADTLILKKNNEAIDGKIVSINDQEVKIDIQVSPTISERRVYKKNEIIEIKQLSKDQKDFKELKKILPTPDGLSFVEYNNLITTSEKFLSAHPLSNLKNKVEEIIKTLKKERAKIQIGWKKIDGKLISKDDYNKNKYNIDAKLLYKNASQFFSNKKYLFALREIEKIKNNHPYSNIHVRAINLQDRILIKLQSKIKYQIKNYNRKISELEKTKNRLTGTDLVNFEKNLQKKEKAFTKKINLENERNIKWKSYSYTKLNTLTDLQKLILSEQEKNINIDKQDILIKNKALNSVRKHVNFGNIESAEKSLKRVKKLFILNKKGISNVEEVDRLKSKLEKYKEEAKKLAEAKNNTTNNKIKSIITGDEDLIDTNENPDGDSNNDALIKAMQKTQAMSTEKSELKQNTKKITRKKTRNTPKKRRTPRKKSFFTIKNLWWFVLLPTLVCGVGFLYWKEKKKK